MEDQQHKSGRPVTPKELAAELGVNPETVRRSLRAGVLLGAQLRGSGPWLIPRSELRRLKGGAVAAGPGGGPED